VGEGMAGVTAVSQRVVGKVEMGIYNEHGVASECLY
jgi:hypothetical protein